MSQPQVDTDEAYEEWLASFKVWYDSLNSAKAKQAQIDTVDCSKTIELARFESWGDLINIGKFLKVLREEPYPKVAKIGEVSIDPMYSTVMFTKIVNRDSLTEPEVQLNYNNFFIKKYKNDYLTADKIIDIVTNWWIVEESRKTLRLPDHQACRAWFKEQKDPKSKWDKFFVLWAMDHKIPLAVKNRLEKRIKEAENKKNRAEIILLNEYK